MIENASLLDWLCCSSLALFVLLAGILDAYRYRRATARHEARLREEEAKRIELFGEDASEMLRSALLGPLGFLAFGKGERTTIEPSESEKMGNEEDEEK